MARRKQKTDFEETQYWLSYSDMMAGLLLVFVLIIAFSILHDKQLLEKRELELIELQKIAEEKRQEAEEQRKQLEEQRKQLEEQKITMRQQQEKLDRIVGVRKNVVQALKDEFEGTDMKVTVDEKTGAITLDSSVLFDNNKDILKDTGQGFLEAFLPKYFDVLLQPEFLDYISEIIIEGHTDTKGTYLYNLNLSQKRAMSVANFCLDEKKDVLDQKSLDRLREIITANGKSFSTPVYDANGNIDMDASRRVEFKFRLKDDEMIEEMIDILENEDEGK